ncbi:MAG: type I-C CRISPR-associated protein Cas8c/Csd1 [Clostridiales bacterium]|jgi:CRISPR-associated protein Csd1|nr:type I-C CRISPR-associated protein Cas8c/Csd1 [Clostridiales bacterium]
MILQALCGYYKRLASDPAADVAEPGWAASRVSAYITLNEDGDVVNVTSLMNGKNPTLIITPQQPKRSGSKPEPAFLCENAEFLFGIYKNAKGAEYRFTASQARHETVLEGVDDTGAKAVLNFFRKRVLGEYPDVEHSALETGGNIVFRLELDTSYIHDRRAVRAAWNRYSQNIEDGAGIGQCLVTGETGPIARLHGNISGFGQDKPTLVCFNASAFESYCKKQGGNAPVSVTAAFQYVTALSSLNTDSRHTIRLGDTRALFWAERSAPEEEDLFAWLLDIQPADKTAKTEGDASATSDEVSAKKIKSFLSSLHNGKPPGSELEFDPDVTFHVFGISAAKTRLVVRFFYSNTFGTLLERIGQHYLDIEIFRANDELELVTPYKILIRTAVNRDRKNIPKMLEGALMRSILGGTPYPYSLYLAMLDRVRAGDGIDHVRAGVIKGFLNRAARFDNKTEEMITVSLNPEERNTGYLLGRLFAALEKAQYDALGQLNATIVDKYLNSALASPEMVFVTLLPLFEKHVAKSEKYYTKQLVQKIIDAMGSDGFPKVLNAEDQGKFLIGYYHQREKFYAGKPQKEDPGSGSPGSDGSDSEDSDNGDSDDKLTGGELQ